MSDIRIACAQLTWHDMTEDEILGDIAASGYEGSPPVIG